MKNVFDSVTSLAPAPFPIRPFQSLPWLRVLPPTRVSGYWTLFRIFNYLTALFTQNVCLNTPILNLQFDFFLRVELWKQGPARIRLSCSNSRFGQVQGLCLPWATSRRGDSPLRCQSPLIFPFVWSAVACYRF